MSLLVVKHHEFSTFSKNANRAMMSPSSEDDESMDLEIVELAQHHHSSCMPMLPLDEFDDIMDDQDHGVRRHEKPESFVPRTTTIYLQPRVAIHGCRIPPIAAPPERSYYYDDDHMIILSARAAGRVPTFQDLGLLPMFFSPDDEDKEFSKNETTNDTTLSSQ